MYLKIVSNTKLLNDYIKVKGNVRTKRVNYNIDIYEMLSSNQDNILQEKNGVTIYMTDKSLKKLAKCDPDDNNEMIVMIFNGDKVYLFHDNYDERFNCYLLDEEGQTVEKLI